MTATKLPIPVYCGTPTQSKLAMLSAHSLGCLSHCSSDVGCVHRTTDIEAKKDSRLSESKTEMTRLAYGRVTHVAGA